MPDPDPHIEHHLTEALIHAQQLHKRLRKLCNRGEATEAAVTAAGFAIAELRRCAVECGVKPVDIDRGHRSRS
jgi:hypothetical protein